MPSVASHNIVIATQNYEDVILQRAKDSLTVYFGLRTFSADSEYKRELKAAKSDFLRLNRESDAETVDRIQKISQSIRHSVVRSLLQNTSFERSFNLLRKALAQLEGDDVSYSPVQGLNLSVEARGIFSAKNPDLAPELDRAILTLGIGYSDRRIGTQQELFSRVHDATDQMFRMLVSKHMGQDALEDSSKVHRDSLKVLTQAREDFGDHLRRDTNLIEYLFLNGNQRNGNGSLAALQHPLKNGGSSILN